jgi:hypothetical protein
MITQLQSYNNRDFKVEVGPCAGGIALRIGNEEERAQMVYVEVNAIELLEAVKAAVNVSKSKQK